MKPWVVRRVVVAFAVVVLIVSLTFTVLAMAAPEEPTFIPEACPSLGDGTVYVGHLDEDGCLVPDSN